ncbi:MAG: hypothetical protein KBB11_07705 [Bacteroidales bacterium]|nr:hypothetical protein [Bacteroidales bacterium]HOY39364.1 hypothetical protein [Bacteroidales bacterium]
MSNTIDLNNYEAWLLDFIEGNLSESEENILMAFLKSNPELCDEVDNLTPFTLKADKNEKCSIKKNLKKDFDADTLMISSVEGLLSDEQNAELEQLCQTNEQVIQDYEQYRKTILHPDTTIAYTDKLKLKHHGFAITPLQVLAAAVIVILAASAFALTYFGKTDTIITTALKNRTAEVSNYNIRKAFTDILHTDSNTYVAMVKPVPTIAVPQITDNTMRTALAKLPHSNIEPINVTLAPVQMGYCNETLHAVAGFEKTSTFNLSQWFDKGVISEKLTAFTEKSDIKSPIKLLRKTKEDLLSQDYLAEIRNFKNNK